MDWVVSPGFAAEVLAAVALIVLVPSSLATMVAVTDRRAGRTRAPVRVVAVARYALSALVLLALATFLLVNHVRIENIRLT
jgi:hypothetical protein